ncbi:MAG: microcin ABC transporter permease [Legionellales bacterium]|nr:microcin ABC transporter permease [Legionellales bacterium]OUX67798.1 MAG: microcin ABC transporter permease [bacterium TMED178]
MYIYLLKRCLLMIPTLLGILTINFAIVQCVPGGPVEQMAAKLYQVGDQSILGAQNDLGVSSQGRTSLSGTAIPDEVLKEIKKMYGFDQPITVRYFDLLSRYAQFDLGDSLFRHIKVIDLIGEKLPVSASLGIWTTVLMYLIAIPLGIRKATRHGKRFDVWTSTVLIVCNAVPTFLIAMLLMIVFCGGDFLAWFPMRGLTSDYYSQLNWMEKIGDYLWHLVLPVFSLLLGSCASIAFLTKNAFLEEIHQQYVITARSKGITERAILYGHVFRNAMLIIIAMFPGAFIFMFFSGALLIEIIFSLDGIGLMGYQAIIQRDYPVVLGSLYLFTLLGLFARLLGDLAYAMVDRRIDFTRVDS